MKATKQKLIELIIIGVLGFIAGGMLGYFFIITFIN